MGNIVAIVGRPNVGKSTLFNRLTGTRQAIVNEEAGTTRDRQYGKVEWTGKEFSLIDTGGWVVNSEDVFEEEINKQVKVAIEEADVILFVVDVLNGITDLDMEVAQILRRCKRPGRSFTRLAWEILSASRPSMVLIPGICWIRSWRRCPRRRWRYWRRSCPVSRL